MQLKAAAVFIVALALSACAASENDTATDGTQAFLDNLQSLCGNSYTGKVTSQDAADADWRAEVLTVGPIECGAKSVRMPLAVGEDQSRVWVLTPKDGGLHLAHEHTLKDGSPDPVTNYGGLSTTTTATKAVFPADAYSKANFIENGLDVSVTNVWSLENDGTALVYELNRENRNFRAEIDITTPR